jgi:hypothetical protein
MKSIVMLGTVHLLHQVPGSDRTLGLEERDGGVVRQAARIRRQGICEKIASALGQRRHSR